MLPTDRVYTTFPASSFPGDYVQLSRARDMRWHSLPREDEEPDHQLPPPVTHLDTLSSLRRFIATHGEPPKQESEQLPSSEAKRQCKLALNALANAAKSHPRGSSEAKKAWRVFFVEREKAQAKRLVDGPEPLTAEQAKSYGARGIWQFNGLKQARRAAKGMATKLSPGRFLVLAKHPQRADWWLFADQYPADMDSVVEVVYPPRRQPTMPVPQLPVFCQARFRRMDLIMKRFTVMFREPFANEYGEVVVRATSAEEAEEMVRDAGPNLTIVDAQEWAMDWENDDFPVQCIEDLPEEAMFADEYEQSADIIG